jgi:uncharacterized protein YcbX
MATVSRLSVTAVKGTALLHPSQVTLTELGVVENRRFYLADRVGFMVSAPDHPPLVRVRTAYDAASEWLTVSFPDGTTVEGSALPGGDRVETDFYGRPVAGAVVDGSFTEAFTRYVGKPVRLVRPDNPGDACDIHHLTLLSDASVDELRRRARLTEAVDERRFRMLIGLGGCQPHEEDEWDGSLLAIGDALVRARGPVARCHLTTRDPDTGDRDLDTLRQISSYRGVREGKHIDFGVYGDVEKAGRIRVGDPVVLEREE